MKKRILGIIFSLLMVLTSVYAQQKEIHGRITSATNNEVLPGVSVLVKGSNQGTVTDAEGQFVISATEGQTLVFRYLGFLSTEVLVSDQNVVNVVLSEDRTQLQDVVVTALGIERSERSLGYSTQDVSGEDLTMTKQQNVIGSLAGKIAGVQVVGSSAASMGGTQKIKIRGINSLTGEGEPLIVVDGTPISNANYAGASGGDFGNLGQDVNSDDVESVNVLKGPTASALYGLRGQYGVIMITTKKGKRGPKTVDIQLNSAFSFQKIGEMLPLQNLYGGGGSQTWRTLPNGDKYVDVLNDESWGPKMDGTLVRDVYSFYPQDATYGQLTPFVPHPDNIRDFFETGTNLNNGVSVTGGNENSSYRLSFNDTRITGIEPNTWLKRNNVGVNGSLDLNDKVTVSSNMNFATNKGQRPSQGYDGGSRGLLQWFQRNVDMTRMKDYKYPDGTFLHWNLRRPSAVTGEITDFRALYWNNPYFEAYENLNEDSRDRLFGDVGVTYRVLPELKLSAFARGDLFTQNIESREATGSRYTPEYYVGKFQNKEMNYEFLANYTKVWDDFTFDGNIGANLYTRNYTYLSQNTNGGLSSPGFYNIEASIDRPTTTSYALRKETRSVYALASLGYKNTWFLDASLRNDNSSTLPDNNNSYWYPSVSGSFVFSELIDWNTLSFGKLRASYAKAGSDMAPYGVYQTYGVGGIYGGTNTMFESDLLANPLIEPSFANSFEIGTDLNFFNSRLGISFTYYEQKNRNQIINLDVSGASGYSQTRINAGLIENRGIELTLTGSPIQTEKFAWNAVFNLSKNRSKVVELYPGTNVYPIASNRYSSVDVFLNSYVGEPFGSLIGKAYQRDEASGKILLGDDNMPLYTAADHNFGSVLPDFTGGFHNTFRLFNKVDLGAMIDFQFGGQFFSWSKMLSVKTGMAEETAALNENGMNVRDPLDDGGGVKVSGISNSTGEEVNAFVDARSYFRNVLGTHVYEEWLYDASYIKLRELSLGYTFENVTIGNHALRQVQISLIASNPVQIWQKAPKGLDPSELSSGASSISWLETGGLNIVRSYGINLKVNF